MSMSDPLYITRDLGEFRELTKDLPDNTIMGVVIWNADGESESTSNELEVEIDRLVVPHVISLS